MVVVLVVVAGVVVVVVIREEELEETSSSTKAQFDFDSVRFESLNKEFTSFGVLSLSLFHVFFSSIYSSSISNR